MAEIIVRPYQVPEIKWNYEEVKAELEQILTDYRGLVYTTDTIGEAKKDRAKLNSLAKALNDRKIALKKDYCRPLDDFESKMKELIVLVNSASSKIDEQVKAYESEQKEKKQEEIDEIVRELWLFDFPIVNDPKWLNASTKISSIREEIEMLASSTKYDIESIDTMDVSEERRTALMQKYVETRNLRDVLVYNKTLTDAQKPKEEPKSEPMMSVSFRVIGTKNEIIRLKEFLERNNINFERV